MMYGRYVRHLGAVESTEDLSEKEQEKRRLKEDKARKKELRGRGSQGKLAKYLRSIWRRTFAKLGEDWVFLALLGVIMALVSFLMDRGIALCNEARLWLYNKSAYSLTTQYVAWVALPVILVLFSSGLAQLVAPQSIGSGIPEMKTILRGVAMKEYLTFRTLVVKVIGLTATLGSGVPVGKEGPFVHIASMTAALLGKLVTRFQGIYQNESRATEMLAAACAVGVASCFAAPVGGVLFSIEVTTVYFAVRNYWRGFFAAVCGATTFRLLAVWFQKADTVTAVFKTNFHMDFPFDPQELFVFALIGAICGVGGAFYVWVHRRYVIFMGNSKILNFLKKKNRLLYPGVATLIVSSITFPPGAGQFIGGELLGNNQVVSLFTNFTWTGDNATIEEKDVILQWTNPWTDVVANLALYTIFTFVASVICTTMPVPCGLFIPVFKIGAGFGRMVGELMHIWFPTGMRYGGNVAKIIPGGYAAVGAAAFSGSVTHTISVSVIVFEMTGQITHIIPIMIAVLISNAIASLLAPSIYDSIIMIKKLPYVPDLLPTSSGIYRIYVEDFMVRDVKYICYGTSYKQLLSVLKEHSHLQSFPLVDKPESMVLLGSIQRIQLVQLIEYQIGREKRIQVATLRRRTAEIELKTVEDGQRRPSMLKKQMSENQLDQTTVYNLGSRTKKSVWKKANTFTFRPFPSTNSVSNPYQTVTSPDNTIRFALDSIFSASSNLQDADDEASQNQDIFDGSLSNKIEVLPMTSASSNSVHLSLEGICDMDHKEQTKWEEEQMAVPVDFSTCHIDPAPFQLVEQTSLLKVHFLFSMVGVKYGYVTAIGKLVGVVGLKELRKAIEDANSGALPYADDENDDETFCIDDKDCSVGQGTDSAMLSKDSEV